MTTLPDFGSDLSCEYDCDALFVEVDGVTALLQSLVRRLQTPRGSVIDAPDYGLDVRLFLNNGITPTERATIPGRIAAELLKDERVSRADVALATSAPDRLELSIRVESAEGPFEFVLDVTAAAVKLTEVTP